MKDSRSEMNSVMVDVISIMRELMTSPWKFILFPFSSLRPALVVLFFVPFNWQHHFSFVSGCLRKEKTVFLLHSEISLQPLLAVLRRHRLPAGGYGEPAVYEP